MKKITQLLSSSPEYSLQNTTFITHDAQFYWNFDGREVQLPSAKIQPVLEACLSQGLELDLNRSTGSDNFSRKETSLASCMTQQQKRQQKVEQANQKKRTQYQSQKNLEESWQAYEKSQQSIPEAQQTLTEKQQAFNHTMLAKDAIVSVLLKQTQQDLHTLQQKKNAQQNLENDQNSIHNQLLKSFAQRYYDYQQQLQQHQAKLQKYQKALDDYTEWDNSLGQKQNELALITEKLHAAQADENDKLLQVCECRAKDKNSPSYQNTLEAALLEHKYASSYTAQLKSQIQDLTTACKIRARPIAPQHPSQPQVDPRLRTRFSSMTTQVIVKTYEKQQETYLQNKKDLAQEVAQLNKTIADRTQLTQQVQALQPITGLAHHNTQQPVVFADAQVGAQSILKAHQAYLQAETHLHQKTHHKKPTQPKPQGPIQEPNYESIPQCTITPSKLFATSSRHAWKKALQQERDHSQQVQTFAFAQKRGYAWRIIGIIALQAALFATTYVSWQALRSWAIMSLFNPAPALTGLACGAALLGGLGIFGSYMLVKNAALESYLDYVSHIFDSLVKPGNKEAVKADNGQIKEAKWWQCRFFWGYETQTAHYQEHHSYKATAANDLAPAQNHNEIKEKPKTSSSYIANAGCATTLPIR